MTITVRHQSTEVPVIIGPLDLAGFNDAFVLTDANVARLFEQSLDADRTLVIPPGEASKSGETYLRLVSQLVERGAKRSSRIIALGGGVIGDLAGFVAGTYMRGVPYIQVPTTLLAQVDSSVGGKVGIDLESGKNLIGLFNPPRQVWVDPSVLKTLPARQFASGMAEVIKYGLILDSDLLDQLTRQPLNPGSAALTGIIARCIQLKADVVAEDEFETKGVRAKLNFGHTIGHAIEQVTHYAQFTHGEAIAIGMVKEAELAVRLGLAEPSLVTRTKAALIAHDLPVSMTLPLDCAHLIAAMQKDKKSASGELTMALVSQVGVCKLVQNIPVDQVIEVLR